MTTQKIKKGFRDMHSHMEEQIRKQQDYTSQPPQSDSKSKHKAGEYIDFEEV